LLAVEETCSSMTFQVDLFITQEICLLSECLNDPADEFEESRVQAELSALYILWISKAANHPLYPACFYSNHVFARIDSCAAKGLSLTGEIVACFVGCSKFRL